MGIDIRTVKAFQDFGYEVVEATADHYTVRNDADAPRSGALITISTPITAD